MVELELLVCLVEDGHAGDVAGQQVGRELDAPPLRVHAGRDGAGERGLAGARHVLDQQVPLGEQADQSQLDGLVLAADDAFDVAREQLEALGELPGQLRGLLLRNLLGRLLLRHLRLLLVRLRGLVELVPVVLVPVVVLVQLSSPSQSVHSNRGPSGKPPSGVATRVSFR